MRFIKYILIAVFVFLFVASQSQPNLPATFPNPKTKGFYEIGYLQPDSAILFGVGRDTSWHPKSPALVYWLHGGFDSVFWFYNKLKWAKLSSSTNIAFDGSRPITINVAGFSGVVPNGTDVVSFLNNLLYPSQIPTSALTATYNGATSNNFVLEQMAAGSSLNVVLNWSGGRQLSTLNLSTINVDGVNQSFVNPIAGSSVSGTKNSTVPLNADKTFLNVVTTSDGKIAISSVFFTFQWNLYYGFVNSTSPDDATIRGLTNEFFTTRQHPSFSTNLSPSGSQNFIIAFPLANDPANLDKIWINGLDQTGAFTRTTRTFVNASGGSATYVIYVSVSPTSGSIQFTIL